MRTLLALASVTLLVVGGFGCGDDTTTTSVADMTVIHDLSANPADMMTLTCAQILTCERACTTAACQTACVAEGTTAAKGLIGQFLLCLVNACNPDAGNPNGACSGLTDTSAGCLNCLNQTGLGAATGGTCNTQFMACASM